MRGCGGAANQYPQPEPEGSLRTQPAAARSSLRQSSQCAILVVALLVVVLLVGALEDCKTVKPGTLPL